jgi:hypothetical protein
MQASGATMRKKAAAVPATKVDLDKVYAIRHDGKLVRFRPTSVTTVRHGQTGSPHDYESHVTGRIDPQDSNAGVVHIQPNALLGEYQEHVELVERERREKAARDHAQQLENEKVLRLQRLLYEISGLEQPVAEEGRDDYNALIRRQYDNDIEINKKAADALLAGLERLMEQKESVS